MICGWNQPLKLSLTVVAYWIETKMMFRWRSVVMTTLMLVAAAPRSGCPVRWLLVQRICFSVFTFIRRYLAPISVWCRPTVCLNRILQFHFRAIRFRFVSHSVPIWSGFFALTSFSRCLFTIFIFVIHYSCYQSLIPSFTPGSNSFYHTRQTAFLNFFRFLAQIVFIFLVIFVSFLLWIRACAMLSYCIVRSI